MTLTELKEILSQTGYPVAYSHFVKAPTLPYIVYFVAYSSHYMADNQVYHEIENVQIELYTSKKDLVAEQKVKDILKKNEIPFFTTETFIESEQLFQKIFEVRLM